MFLWPATLLSLGAIVIVSGAAVAGRTVSDRAAWVLLIAVGMAAAAMFSTGMAASVRTGAVDIGTNLNYVGEQMRLERLEDARGWELASAVLTAAGFVSAFIGVIGLTTPPSGAGKQSS